MAVANGFKAVVAAFSRAFAGRLALSLTCSPYGTGAALIDAHLTFSAAIRDGDISPAI